ncbi:TlpA family protein disulfide reductase [Hominifimenecus sp. rT4P-3]|uniref:TlpA family protein disulfide reductase n=1 Tax=Hominifimenecus sp. rT4P-3 TaxID=3242979 RepID=UPI003DA3B5DF
MNSKKKFWILLLVLVCFLGGASILYTQLGKKLAPEQLALQETKQTAGTKEREPGTEAVKAGEEKESEEKAPETSGGEPEKIAAPDFIVYDIDGNEIHLSDYIGKPIVLNFWASWCGPCQMEMPDFQEKYLESGEEIHFLMINMTDGSRETVEDASEFIKNQEYTFPVFYDTASSAAMTYGVYSLPTTYFVDAEGYLVTRATGAIDGETLQKGIDMITSEAK